MIIHRLAPPPIGRKAVSPIAPAPAPAVTFSKLSAPAAHHAAPSAASTTRLGPPPRSVATAPDGPVSDDHVERSAAQYTVPARELTFGEKYPDGYGSNYKPKTRYGKDGRALPTRANPEADEIPW